MTAVSLYDLRREQIEALLAAEGVRPVHAAVLWKAMYDEGDDDALRMSRLPPPLVRWLDSRREGGGVRGQRLTVEMSTASADARARKFLLRLEDGLTIEAVAMEYPGRTTGCISTQAGCAMGCVFCATGQAGFSRHLTASEITAQVIHLRRHLAAGGERLRNLVLMGMGEPLHNYDQVMQALAIVSDRAGLNIGQSRITVNTVGVVPGILRMAREQQPYNLGVSLHGSTEAERASLIPVSSRWPLDELMAACRTYSERTRRRILFAWTLIAGVNDTHEHATRLVGLLQGTEAHLNLIRLNATAGYGGRDCSDQTAAAFRAVVRAAGIPCTIRQRRGVDVAAGCGQLKASNRSMAAKYTVRSTR